MSSIICRDSFGRNLEYLTQWDVNRSIYICGVATSPPPRIRFSNKISTVSLVVKPEINEDSIRADIPNILLQQPYSIIASIFYEYDNDEICQTEHIFTIPVVPCKIPEDYFMTENVEYVCWIDMQNRALELIGRLEKERDGNILIVHDIEPDLTDVLWFDTSVSKLE